VVGQSSSEPIACTATIPPRAVGEVLPVAVMAAQHPERFSDTALRRRRNHWVRQVALGFALSGLAAILVPLAWPGAATVAPTFFLMGGLCVLPAVTLWRAATTVHYCAPHAQVIGQAPRHPLSRVRTR
jgi:hypothetical protein